MKKLILLSLLLSSCLSSEVRQGITIPEDAEVAHDIVDVGEVSITSFVDTCTCRCPVQEPTVIVKTIYVERLPNVVRFPDDDGVTMNLKE